MAAKHGRKARTPDPAAEAPAAELRAVRPAPSTTRSSLDPLIQALTRAIGRQAPARPSGLQDNRAD